MSTPQPQFVTAAVDGSGAPQSVKSIARLDAYLALYVDGAGKEQVRICFKVPGSDSVFVLSEMIGGRKVATSATGWFKEAFNGELKMLPNAPGEDADESGVASI